MRNILNSLSLVDFKIDLWDIKQAFKVKFGRCFIYSLN